MLDLFGIKRRRADLLVPNHPQLAYAGLNVVSNDNARRRGFLIVKGMKTGLAGLSQSTVVRLLDLVPEDNKTLKGWSMLWLSEGHAEKILEEQYRDLAISQKRLLIHAQSRSVVIKLNAEAVVVLDVRLINTGQAIANVLPEQTHKAWEAVLDGLEILAWNLNSRLGSRKRQKEADGSFN
jgi:hypothetical protein